eukprot:1936978-Pleurochrysis_carterae.AAC.3
MQTIYAERLRNIELITVGTIFLVTDESLISDPSHIEGLWCQTHRIMPSVPTSTDNAGEAHTVIVVIYAMPSSMATYLHLATTMQQEVIYKCHCQLSVYDWSAAA